MIHLTTPSDRLSIVTDAAVPIDADASFVDVDAANDVFPDAAHQEFTGPGAVDLVGGPSAGRARNVKLVTVRNVHAATPVGVDVRHSDGAIVVSLFARALPAGWTLQYTDADDFRVLDATGEIQ